jgi:hypothetical protein
MKKTLNFYLLLHPRGVMLAATVHAAVAHGVIAHMLAVVMCSALMRSTVMLRILARGGSWLWWHSEGRRKKLTAAAQSRV